MLQLKETRIKLENILKHPWLQNAKTLKELKVDFDTAYSKYYKK